MYEKDDLSDFKIILVVSKPNDMHQLKRESYTYKSQVTMTRPEPAYEPKRDYKPIYNNKDRTQRTYNGIDMVQSSYKMKHDYPYNKQEERSSNFSPFSQNNYNGKWYNFNLYKIENIFLS